MVGILYWMNGDGIPKIGCGPQCNRVQGDPIVIIDEQVPRLQKAI